MPQKSRDLPDLKFDDPNQPINLYNQIENSGIPPQSPKAASQSPVDIEPGRQESPYTLISKVNQKPSANDSRSRIRDPKYKRSRYSSKAESRGSSQHRRRSSKGSSRSSSKAPNVRKLYGEDMIYGKQRGGNKLIGDGMSIEANLDLIYKRDHLK